MTIVPMISWKIEQSSGNGSISSYNVSQTFKEKKVRQQRLWIFDNYFSLNGLVLFIFLMSWMRKRESTLFMSILSDVGLPKGFWKPAWPYRYKLDRISLISKRKKKVDSSCCVWWQKSRLWCAGKWCGIRWIPNAPIFVDFKFDFRSVTCILIFLLFIYIQ